MDLHRDEVFELTTVRPSLDIVDCRFEASPEMEQGDGSQSANTADTVNDDNQRDGSQPGLGSTTGSSEAQTGEATQVVEKQTSWIQGLKSLFSGPPKKYVRKDRIVVDKLEDHPNGYPRLASYINSDPNFAMYRRFGYLQNRVLLYRQDELCVLQEKLETLDDEDAEKDPRLLTSRERDELNSTTRRDLISEIDAKLKEFHTLVFNEARLRSLDPPSNRNHGSLWNWLDNNRVLIKTEKSFVYYKDDFVLIGGGKENAPADEVLERTLNKLDWKIFKYTFSTREQREISEDGYDHYYSKTRIQLVTRAVGTICVLALVIVPVYYLFQTHASTLKKLCIVIGCTLIFPFIIDAFSRIERQQVFAITVAYCAVLVVFLGNLQSVNCNQAANPPLVN